MSQRKGWALRSKKQHFRVKVAASCQSFSFTTHTHHLQELNWLCNKTIEQFNLHSNWCPLLLPFLQEESSCIGSLFPLVISCIITQSCTRTTHSRPAATPYWAEKSQKDTRKIEKTRPNVCQHCCVPLLITWVAFLGPSWSPSQYVFFSCLSITEYACKWLCPVTVDCVSHFLLLTCLNWYFTYLNLLYACNWCTWHCVAASR